MTQDPAGEAIGGRRSAAPGTTAPEPAIGSVSYAALAAVVVGAEPLGAVLARIAEQAAETVPGADDVSVTLLQRDRARTVAFSGDGRLAAALDERQYEDGFGPCMDAAATGQVIEIVDTASDPTYPSFSRQARRHGVTRALAVGMPTAHDTSGALNIYASGPAGRFDQAARDAATALAGFAGIALLNTSLYAGAVDEVAQMREAMASRAGIEQAKGILMHQHRCSAEEAFDILRIMSARSNRKLRDVAREVVDGVI